MSSPTPSRSGDTAPEDVRGETARRALPKCRIKKRAGFLLCALACMGAGLAARCFSGMLPPLFAAYFPDAVWAAMVYCGLGALFSLRPRPHAVLAAAFCLAVELSQLVHFPLLDAARFVPLGRLVLGQGFLWSDLACYAVGIVLAAALRRAAQKEETHRPGARA